MQKFGVTEISNFYLQPNNLRLTGFYFSSKYGYAKVKTRETEEPEILISSWSCFINPYRLPKKLNELDKH